MNDLLLKNLNIAFLRPESALFDAIAAYTIGKRMKVKHPSVDFGCGNGIFSFICAGGDIKRDWDMFKPLKINRGQKKQFLQGSIFSHLSIKTLCQVNNQS